MNNYEIKRRKKLIEVAMPLDVINRESAREKSIRHGHPSTLHLWWARRPLAAARAVIFCQLVDDPSSVPELFPTVKDQTKERKRLFYLIEELVVWENTINSELFDRAKEEINISWLRCCEDNSDHPNAKELFNPKNFPAFHDPFAGGGALPLEAQRLGLQSFGSDLNPVAVLLNKSLIQIPSQYQHSFPINPDWAKKNSYLKSPMKSSDCIANDIDYYGQSILKAAERKIKEFYPTIMVSLETVEKRPELKGYLGKNLIVVAWIWARTVKSPNPNFSHVDVPLVSSFILSSKKNNPAFVEPIIEGDEYFFEVKNGQPKDLERAKRGTKLARGAFFECILSGTVIDDKYIKSESNKGNMGKKLMAIVAEGTNNRIYLSPDKEHEVVEQSAYPEWKPSLPMNRETRDLVSGRGYGFFTWGDLFTNRQLLALDTFSNSLSEVSKQIEIDAINAGMSPNNNLSEGEISAKGYKEAIETYLSLAISRASDAWSTIVTWRNKVEASRGTFARQAIPMTWDFTEVNPFSNSCGNWQGNSIKWVVKSLKTLPENPKPGVALQLNAATQSCSNQKIISTDPPYYNNIAYADLSDYFYIWLRRCLKDIYPNIFATLSVPKEEEVVALAHRHDSKKEADNFFLDEMTKAMGQLSQLAHQGFPLTIYYAFKQSETKDTNKTVSTGWETFLSALMKSNLSITGTWPIRTELSNRLVGSNKNMLASSIVLVCERKNPTSQNITSSEFRRKLRQKLPNAINELETSNIAPVDVAQAAIGPGMSLFSQAKSVLNPDDSIMTVREALIEINYALDEYLSKEESEMDNDSRFAVTFFESFGYSERPFGDAEGLAKARNLSVEGIVRAGIMKALGGKVMLIRRDNLLSDWDPIADNRLCAWEATQYLIRELEIKGEEAAAALLVKLKSIVNQEDLASNCKALAYRLYNHCEKTNQAEEARAYNSLIISWPELERFAAETRIETTIQTKLM